MIQPRSSIFRDSIICETFSLLVEAGLGSSKKIQLDKQLITVKKQIGQFISKVAEEAYLLKDPNEIIIKFSASIITRYRQLLLNAKKENRGSNQLTKLESIFDEAASKTMEFLHHQYPQPTGFLPTSSNIMTKIDVDPRYSLVHKMLDHPMNRKMKDKIRMNVNMLLYNLIMYSQDQFHVFEEKMVQIFELAIEQKGNKSQSGLQKEKKQVSSAEYSFSKRLAKNISFKNMNVKSPAFVRTDKETIHVLMDWYYELIKYFKEPSRLIDNKHGFRNTDGGITKLVYKDRVKLSQLFKKQNQKLSKELQQGEKSLRKIIRNIILISNKTLQSESKKQHEETYPEDQDASSDIRTSFERIELNEMVNKHFDYRDLPFVDNEELSFIKICDDIYKAVNDHIMSILTTVIANLKQVEECYYAQLLRQNVDSPEKLQFATFTIPNMYKCQYTGTIQQITELSGRIRQQKDIQVILYNNRMDTTNKDIIINFVVNNSKIKYPFISQIRLSTINRITTFSFSNFLLEQSSTPFGIIAELGLLFQNLDTRNKYIKKTKVVYKKQINNFVLKDGVLKCGANQYHTIVQRKIEDPYICHICFKYRFAYMLNFQPYQCKQCEVSICPICYLLKFTSVKQITDYLLHEDFRDIALFFELDNMFFSEGSEQNFIRYIKNKFNEENPSSLKTYYGVLKIEFNIPTPHFNIVKYVKPIPVKIKRIKTEKCIKEDGEDDSSSQEQEWQDRTMREKIKNYLTFSNIPMQFSARNNCIYLIFKPKIKTKIVNKKQYLNKEGGYNYVQIGSLHQTFFPQIQKQYIACQDESKNRLIIIDYNISDKAIYQVISDNSTRIKLKNVEKSDMQNQFLKLSDLAINPNLFNKMSVENRRKIQSLNINHVFCQMNEITKSTSSVFDMKLFPSPLSTLELFDNLKVLRIDNTQLEIYTIKLPLLEELYLESCLNIRELDFNYYKRIRIIGVSPFKSQAKLAKLDLPQFITLQLRKTKITDITQLRESYIPSINRICITVSNIDVLPLMESKCFNNLRVLEFRYLSRKAQDMNVQNLRQCALINLKYLIIENCHIKGTFPSLANFVNLQCLRLSHNEITFIERFELKKLKQVDLCQNQLKKLPEIISPVLQTYQARNNNLNSELLKESLGQIYAYHLDILYNPDLEYLPLAKTKIQFILIERKKVPWEIKNLQKVHPRMPQYSRCDYEECGKLIRTIGRITNPESYTYSVSGLESEENIEEYGEQENEDEDQGQLDFCLSCFEKYKKEHPNLKKKFVSILCVPQEEINNKSIML